MQNKILIVDDEKAVIHQVKALLDSFGYKTFYIPRAQFLIKRLETETFDLILMDINMPGIDGIKALKQLKSNFLYENIPVIMMTADTSDETLESCFDFGAADYITKPISELVLKSRVKSVLDKQEYIKEIFLKNEKLKDSERKIKIAHNNIKSSINYAQTIQSAVMPSKNILDKVFSQNFVFFKPRDVVSGDFYWMKTIGNLVFIAVADCTGHGVPGAFISILGVSLLNEVFHTAEQNNQVDPAKLLGILRKKVKESLGQTGARGEQKDGMDIALCIINKKTHTLQFAGAHNPIYIVRNKNRELSKKAKEYIFDIKDDIAFVEIKGDRQPIGIHRYENKFTNHQISLKTGDLIYLFSDGYADQTGSDKHRKFMRRRFKELFLEIHEKPMNEQKIMMSKTLKNWMGAKEEQVDDILVMGLKYDEAL